MNDDVILGLHLDLTSEPDKRIGFFEPLLYCRHRAGVEAEVPERITWMRLREVHVGSAR